MKMQKGRARREKQKAREQSTQQCRLRGEEEEGLKKKKIQTKIRKRASHRIITTPFTFYCLMEGGREGGREGGGERVKGSFKNDKRGVTTTTATVSAPLSLGRCAASATLVRAGSFFSEFPASPVQRSGVHIKHVSNGYKGNGHEKRTEKELKKTSSFSYGVKYIYTHIYIYIYMCVYIWPVFLSSRRQEDSSTPFSFSFFFGCASTGLTNQRWNERQLHPRSNSSASLSPRSCCGLSLRETFMLPLCEQDARTTH